MSLQGSLNTIRIPELFSLLHGLRRTGVLLLVTEAHEIQFVLREGGLLYASSRSLDFRIGLYLKRLGVVLDEEVGPAPGALPASTGCFGQRQVELGRVSPEDLRSAVKEQVLDLLGVALAWRQGAFYFEESTLPFGSPQDRPISTQSAILEATRRSDEKARHQDRLPDLDSVLVPSQRLRDPVAPQQDAILGLVDGQRTIQQIIHDSPLDDEATVEALRLCLDREIVAISSRADDGCAGMTLADLRRLPVSPNVPGKLYAILSSQEAQGPRVVSLLAEDPTLAAKTLGALCEDNDPLPRTKIGLATLVDSLGMTRVRAALIPEALRVLYFPNVHPFSKSLWEHAILCARLSRQIALKARFPYPEEAYLAGLLHNLGALALFCRKPDEYQRVVSESVKIQLDLETLEERTFGISHTTAGASIAESWGYPPSLTQVIQTHCRGAAHGSPPLLNIVNVALGALEERGVLVGHSSSLRGQFHASLDALNLQKAKILSLLGVQPRHSLAAKV